MTYPDGEVVTYHYNAAGQVESLTSNKQGRQSVIVDRIGYDKEGHTVYTKLGNGTETTYTYDKQRERLQVMNLTADGQTVMENRYRYDVPVYCLSDSPPVQQHCNDKSPLHHQDKSLSAHGSSCHR